MSIDLGKGEQIKVKARAVEVILGRSANKGTPQIGVTFAVTEGEHQGERLTWMGYFTPNTSARTLESLQHCGWTGDDISVFASDDDTLPALNGLDANEVELVVEGEEYGGTSDKYRGRVFPRVQWVNKLGGGRLDVKNAMSKKDAAGFAAEMKAMIHAARQGGGAGFPHGANAPQSKAASGRKGF